MNTKDVALNQALMLATEKEAVIVDVRSNKAYQRHHLEGAINIPYKSINASTLEALPDKNRTIIVYCYIGVASKQVCELLTQLGYKSVYNVKGGHAAWRFKNLF